MHAGRPHRHLRQDLSVAAIKRLLITGNPLSRMPLTLVIVKKLKEREKFHTEIAFSFVPKSPACCEFNHHLIFLSPTLTQALVLLSLFLAWNGESESEASRKWNIKLTSFRRKGGAERKDEDGSNGHQALTRVRATRRSGVIIMMAVAGAAQLCPRPQMR